MSKGMLGKLPLSEVRGPRDTLEEMLAGEEGSKWLVALKRFLRKENPWEVARPEKVVLTTPEPPRRVVIDCDAQPFIPEDWSIHPEDQIASRVHGMFEFDPAKVALHLEEGQKTCTIVGTELLTALEGQPVLPANVLDALLANTALIPDPWKKDAAGNTRYIYFWGTVYRGRDGNRCVRYLCWDGGEWDWSCHYPAYDWCKQSPAALLAS